MPVTGVLETVPVLIALYYTLCPYDQAAALTALALGLFGALGGILHGGYELALLVTPLMVWTLILARSPLRRASFAISSPGSRCS